MAERPLLIFPTPEKASRTKRKAPPPRVHYPTHTQQGERLSPIFNNLQEAFERRRLEIQQTTMGIDPEQVLVIETIGSIKDFVKVVKRVEGLEWLGELEVDDISPDEDFYLEKDPEKELNGRLYLLMTNQRAMNELLSLWQQYSANPNFIFQRGLTKFRDVFNCLKDIRRWGVRERLFETNVIDYWNESLQYESNRAVRFEIELWYRNSLNKREDAQTNVESLIHELGGQIISRTTIDEIEYHALLGELPVDQIQTIISHPESEFVKCDGIMFFRPSGQFASIHMDDEGETESGEKIDQPLPLGNPVVAILDGMPLVNHALLTDRLIFDDPDNYTEFYRANERDHGTTMASLVIHGDLTDVASPLKTPVYFRPIMKPNPSDLSSRRVEEIPNDVLSVDLIHRAVKRIFEGEMDEEPVASTVKTINISIGDRSRSFDQTMSPLARLLDWLSLKYNVLFVVSAGNHTDKLELSINNDEFDALNSEEKRNIIIKTIIKDARNRRILSPAESINSLTVGALHFDNSEYNPFPDIVDPFSNDYTLPSPVSALGSGYRRSIKPDLVFYGGKQLYRKSIDSNKISLVPVGYIVSPGNKVAATDNLGQLDKTKYTRGTSNAAALISRSSAICCKTLNEIFESQLLEYENSPYLPVLMKTMLVHGCTWGEAGKKIQDLLRTDNSLGQVKSWICRWMGYGLPSIDRVLDCTKQRVTVLGYGELQDEEAHIYKLPLPPSLSSQMIWRKLTITLAFITPVFPRNQKYRGASLWFEANRDFIGVNREEADFNAVRRGTLQHEVFEGTAATPYIDGDNLEIKINCREDAGKFDNPVRYGLAVSLEVSEALNISIYEEVRSRIATVVEIQQQL